MLSSKKSLIKKLWKSSVAGQEENDALSDALKSVLKQSDSKDLKAFALAQESDSGPCWMLPSTTVTIDGVAASPESVCCKVFRWPDLSLSSETVQRLPTCPYASHPDRHCCNPFHFGRVICFSPAPLHRLRAEATTRLVVQPGASDSVSCDSAFEEATVSMSGGRQQRACIGRRTADCVSGEESGVEGSSGASTSFLKDEELEVPVSPARRQHAGEAWLTMAYWEGRERVGRRKTCKKPSVHVHYDGATSLTESFCLGALKNRCRSAAAEKKRQQIGSGFVMWRTADQNVWLYNARQQPMYVQSPTLACPQLESRDDLVKKVPAGHAVQIFDWERAVQLEDLLKHTHRLHFPFDVMAVRVSMVSGWGQGHRRPSIMECPCWIEAFFGSENY